MSLYERLLNETAMRKVRRGEGTGPVSRILSHISLLFLVYTAGQLVKDGLYLPLIILAIFSFTRFSTGVMFIFIAYFVFVAYMLGAVLLGAYVLSTWASAQVGMRNIKRSLYAEHAYVDPLEGMGDLLVVLILQAPLLLAGAFARGAVSIVSWVLFALVTLFVIGRYAFRLSSPWRRLHYPMMFRYSGLAGQEMGLAQAENREFDVSAALRNLVKSVFPTWPDDEVDAFIESAKERMVAFKDREAIVSFLSRSSSVDTRRLQESLERVEEILKRPGEKGISVRYVIAGIVGRICGEEERFRYLEAVFSSRAD